MAEQKSKRGGAGRGQGRKPMHEEPMVPVAIRVTVAQRSKLSRLGGPQWVRDRVDEAPEPDR